MNIFRVFSLALILTLLLSFTAIASTPSEIWNRIFHKNKIPKTKTTTILNLSPEFKKKGKLTKFGNVYFDNAIPFKIILIDKKDKKLLLVSIENNEFKILETFPALFGAKDGDKLVMGDQKTPEGVYYVTSYKSEADLFKQFGTGGSIYGTGAFPLSYPNPIDKIRLKTGGGIWLHGIGVDDKNATNGCVALENNYLDIIKKHLNISAPVIVSHKLIMQSEAEYKHDKQAYLNFLTGFLDLYVDRDSNKFASMIHNDFMSSQFYSKTHYIKTHDKDFKIKKYDISNMKIFRHNGADLLYDFNLMSCINNVSKLTNVRYYFTTDNDTHMKLISEEVSPTKSTAAIDNAVNAFVSSWLSTWQEKDYNEFIKHYSSDFNGYRMGFDKFGSNKKSLFETPGKIDIKISDIKWQYSKNAIVVTFTQDYSAQNLKSVGKKSLIIKGCIGDYKIVSETWRDR